MLRLKEKRRFWYICSCWMKSRCQRHIYDMTRGRRNTQLLLMFFHSFELFQFWYTFTCARSFVPKETFSDRDILWQHMRYINHARVHIANFIHVCSLILWWWIFWWWLHVGVNSHSVVYSFCLNECFDLDVNMILLFEWWRIGEI